MRTDALVDRTWQARLLAAGVLSAAVACGRPAGGGPRESQPPAAALAAPPGRVHTYADEVGWGATTRYPEWFRRVYRYKELVGWVSNWQDFGRGAWKGVPSRELRLGVLQLDPGAVYPFHAHPAPEVYYVMRGTAEWTVGDSTFNARPGTAIHTPPRARHRMVNIGRDTLELLYVWWAPGGDTSVLNVASEMLEGWTPPPGPR